MDGATAFQALQTESLTKDSLLNTLGIKIVVGRILNKNKNPVGENTVKEFQKEILRFKGSPGPITDTDLTLINKNMNNRISYNSLTPKEILFRRDNLTNSPILIDNKKIIQQPTSHRHSSSKASMKHKSKFQKLTPPQAFNLGDLVMLGNQISKTSPLPSYIVEKVPDDTLSGFMHIKKLGQSLRPRTYEVCPEELIHVPNTVNPLVKSK